MMKIRKAVKKDFEEYYKVEQDYQKEIKNYCISDEQIATPVKNKFHNKFLSRIKSKDILYLVLDDGKHLQGFFFGLIEDRGKNKTFKFKVRKIGYAGNVFIRKEFRGKGYFSMFIKEFFKFLKKNKINHCVLHVDQTNEIAMKAYTQLGFKIAEHKMIVRI